MAKAMMHRGVIQFVMQSSALDTSTCTVMPVSHVQLAQTTQPATMPRERTQRVKPSNVQQTTVFSHMLARSAQLRKSTQPETTPRERTQHVTVRRMTPVERATFSMGVITREGRLRARTTSAFARIQIVRRKRHMRVGSVN